MSNVNPLSWVEINRSALKHNLQLLCKCIDRRVLLAPCVKANAYGHGIEETAKILVYAGADWLCVNALFEAQILRKAGIKIPICILGYILRKELPEAVRLNCRVVVYNKETVDALALAAKKTGKKAFVHIKIETGNNRQGVDVSIAADFIKYAQKFPQIRVEAISTHFANIEDIPANEITRLSAYPKFQLENFKKLILDLQSANLKIPIRHCANSAATILYPETHFDMVRPGIAVYGLWPSEEVASAAKIKNPSFWKSNDLKPVLSWKTRIAQIKNIAAGESVGYGCTYKTKKRMRLAILPVGYYDGYDRKFSNAAHVLIHGKKALVRGRVCMNITMADVTKIPNARIEDTATLLGSDGGEKITAEYLAGLAGTINYEITTRINERISRIIV